ncbi:MAG: BT_3044 domain-containing protein [Mangrovibacterium sp.]
MKNKIVILSCLVWAIISTSCLKNDLPEIIESSLNTITAVNFQYRYVDTTYVAPGTPSADTLITVKMVTLNTSIRTSNDTIYCTPTFPSTFPSAQKVNVTLKHIWAYVTIPDAAVIESVDNAPKLGTPGDYSSPTSYKVTAANGDPKVFVIAVKPLPAVNKWEGLYHSTGYFDHPSSPRALDLDKYYSSVDANTITGDHSDLGSSGYTVTIKINADNSCIVTQYASGSVIGEMTPGEVNKYDPATKTFTLHYRYSGSGGYRTISETLTLK